ncbi:Hypothetical predicted protein [Mytilus galloprovincialis]|uniref:Uncharacterized protein n=1 Tax=Mytilus galloprovincialis TaxID=29158 RepID=A0A8B6GEE6_MYTGA|nr:Hypothetical predicted protein [Mytilus galloprovincialis]
MKAVFCLFLLTSIVSVSGLLLTEPCSEVLFDCVVDPCAEAKCDAYLHATCKSNYCGGCTSDFFVGSHWVNCTIAAPSN